jgi:hypothetical protein
MVMTRLSAPGPGMPAGAYSESYNYSTVINNQAGT